MPGWEVWVSGGVVLFAIVVIGYLDWTTKHPATYDGGIPLPIRLLCFLFGLLLAGLGVFRILFTGGISLGLVVISVFLFFVAFMKAEKKPSDPAKPIIPAEKIQSIIDQSPTIQGLDENNELLSTGQVFKMLLSKPIFRIPFILMCFGLFMWGSFLLAVNPSFLEKYGLIVLLIIVIGYAGLKALSIKRIIQSNNRATNHK